LYSVFVKRLRVGVLYGGRSGEHEVSLASAAAIFANLDRTRYEPVAIRIDKEGRWAIADRPPTAVSAAEVIEQARLEAARPVRGGREVHLVARPSEETILSIDRRTADVRDQGHAVVTGLNLDAIFPILHGPYGEDGTIQGLLELANVPYVGAGVLASAVGMDKALMKLVFAATGLPVCPYRVVLRHDWQRNREAIARDLEAAVPGAREIECAVLGNDDPLASVPGEVVPSREFYDYEAKYIDSGSEIFIPADLPPSTVAEIQRLSIAAFQAVDCAGMARVDFLMERETGTIYVNELNTIPGFTTISMYSKLWAASGLEYGALLDRLLALALERHSEKQQLRTSITTSAAGRGHGCSP
jgi:D-alanine-D-alanine ligase